MEKRDTIWAVLFLFAWGLIKTPWESRMQHEMNQMRYGSFDPMTREMRDAVGQGLALAALGGFRGLVANVLWIQVSDAWEKQDWARLRPRVEMVVHLQPRVSF